MCPCCPTWVLKLAAGIAKSAVATVQGLAGAIAVLAVTASVFAVHQVNTAPKATRAAMASTVSRGTHSIRTPDQHVGEAAVRATERLSVSTCDSGESVARCIKDHPIVQQVVAMPKQPGTPRSCTAASFVTPSCSFVASGTGGITANGTNWSATVLRGHRTFRYQGRTMLNERLYDVIRAGDTVTLRAGALCPEPILVYAGTLPRP